MRLTNLLFLILIVNINTIVAQNLFQKTYGGTSMDDANAIISTSDSNFVFVGSTASYGEGLYDVYLVKINAIGDTIWTRTYGGTNNDYGFDVKQTSDGGFIIIASTSSFTPAFRDIYLLRTDSNGILVWSKTYGGIKYDEGISIQQCADLGFILTGWTSSFGAGQGDVYLIKTDAMGDTLWTKTYGGTANDYGYSVKQTFDGGYIIAGYTYYLGQGIIDMLLIKTDSNGDTLWSKTYGGSQNSWAYCVQQTADSGFVLVGSTTSFGVSDNDIYLVKTDKNGLVKWSKTYGGVNSDIGTFVLQTDDYGYIITGITQSFGAGSADVYLVKTDSLGSLEWSKVYGGSNYDYGYSLLQCPDHGYLIAARTASFGFLDDVYLIKTDSIGQSVCNNLNANTTAVSRITLTTDPLIQINYGSTIGNPLSITKSGGLVNSLCATDVPTIISSQNSILIYPNPFSIATNIITKKEMNGAIGILYNTYGQKVKEFNNLIGNSFVIERNNLNPGIYFLYIVNENVVLSTDKIVITE